MQIVGYDRYLDQVCSEYPDVDKKAIAKLVRHGLGMIGYMASENLDVMLNHNLDKYYFYIGRIIVDPYDRRKWCTKQLPKKSRLLHSLSKVPHDGYYYFSLTDEQYELHKEGLPIPLLRLYKLRDELGVVYKGAYDFRIPRIGKSWKIIEYKYDTKDAEYLRKRDAKGSESINDAEEHIDGLSERDDHNLQRERVYITE